MTITLLAPDGVPVTAKQERQAKAAQHGGGSGRPLGGRSGFRVGTPGNVLTATSTTWTLGPCAIMIDPGATTDQGMYGWATDQNITGSGAQGVQASDVTYDRKDIVYILVNDSTAGDGSGAVNANPVYVAGTPGPTPAAPAVPPRGFLIGTITVPKTGGGAPTVLLNPARYAAAGAPLPVSTQAERDALAKYDGLSVQRLDVAGRPVETWDGTRWTNGPVGIPYTPIWTGALNYGAGGSMTGKYWVDGDKVTVWAKVTSGSGASLGSGVISFPLPSDLPIANGQLVLGTGSFATSGGVIRVVHCYASGTTGCSVFAPVTPIQTPGTAGYPFNAGDSIEALITYQTSGV